MSGGKRLPTKASKSEIDAFLEKVARTPLRGKSGGGRLIFALDATASREPTWDHACHIQGEMFCETEGLGGVQIQLVFYRGFGECKASKWVGRPEDLLRTMTKVRCQAGHTQIAKVLRHAITETKRKKVDALIFVGDCMEEKIDDLGHLAGQLGLLGVPCFMFHEGGDPIARRAFQEVARLSGGAFCPFDLSSAQQLRDLLSAVAVFAAGGRKALSDFAGRKRGAVLRLTHQVK